MKKELLPDAGMSGGRRHEKEEKKMEFFLDPKADLTFKRVFGEHKNLVKSLLNALLPLAEDEQIADLEYMNPELIPEAPWRKFSIVDVRCRDMRGRQFLVEMQMLWSPEYKNRVFFNAAKAYVRQAKSGEDYKLQQPVYSLNLVNDVFEPQTEEYYHHYKMVNVKDTDKVIEGLQLVFIELPKFKPDNHADKKLYNLWLRYLTEIGEKTLAIPQEMTENKDVKEAVFLLWYSAFNEAQLLAYDDFWDAISTEKTFIEGATRRGYDAGMEKGMEKGMKEGMKEGVRKGKEEGLKEGVRKGREEGIKMGKEEGFREAIFSVVQTMKRQGLLDVDISRMTGLSVAEIAVM